MNLSIFHINNKKTQLFFTIKKIQTNKSIKNILIDHKPSLVATLNGSNNIIKFVKARSWHEYIKLLWNHSRITKEVKGTQILKELELNVPKIYEVGYGIIPSLSHKYIGYYIMENLTNTGFKEVSKLFTNNEINELSRDKIIASIFAGLKKMRENNIVFSDFHLDNVFSNKDGKIIWIDAGVTTYNTTFSSKRFHIKWNDSIRHYQRYSENKGLLSKKERDMFAKLEFPHEKI